MNFENNLLHNDYPQEPFRVPSADKPILLIIGDTREMIKTIPDNTFQCAITSPPYWGVRDYGVKNQIGAEPDVEDYISDLVSVYSKNKGRAMSYRPPTPQGLKKKDLIGVAWMLAMACQREGWYLRNDIIWYKPNCQPESVRDRLTVSHEYLFLFTKSEKYYFDQKAIKEPTTNGNGTKNKRTVWSINTEPCPEAHFAVFPRALVRPCLLAGTKVNDLVFDPFYGTGTVGVVAKELGRRCVGIEIKDEYIDIARKRTVAVQRDIFSSVPQTPR